MIVIKGRELLIPVGERQIGTIYDSNSEIRTFMIERISRYGIDLSGLNFNIDILFPDGTKNTDLLDKSVSEESIILKWNINARDVSQEGTIFVSVRGFDGNLSVKWSSNKAAMYVGDAVDTAGTTPGSTEFEQIEARVRQYYNQTETSKTAAETAKNQAVSAKEASESAKAAAVSAKEASVSAKDSASGYAADAKRYADSALLSASSASESASHAANQATNASNSASQASEYASQASASASLSAQSALQSSSSASSSASSASSAAQNAISASYSANSAAESAADSARSAHEAEGSAGGWTGESKRYSEQAKRYSEQAKSWAVGNSGEREGEDTDNAKYYSEQAKYFYEYTMRNKLSFDDVVKTRIEELEGKIVSAATVKEIISYIPSLTPLETENGECITDENGHVIILS